MPDDPILTSLEVAVENSGDITPLVYEKYFARCPDSSALMSHMDDITKGKMMDEVYRLVMTEDYIAESDYLNWEVQNHEYAYNVEPHMYESLFTALVEAVRESVGSQWSSDMETAWLTRCDELRNEIVKRFSVN